MEENFINNSEIDNLIEILDELWETFKRCRDIFPLVIPENVGIKEIKVYNNVSLHFKDGLTNSDKDGINKSGHHINQNFIVRVYALLDSKKIMPRKYNKNNKSNNGYPKKLDKSIDGYDDADILRRLRHIIAHTNGKYNLQNKEQKKLYNQIVEHYKLTTPPNHPDEWRLPIDTVLFPMFEGCKKYSVEFLKNKQSLQ